MAEYATINNLNRFLTKIVEKFANKIHTHTKDQVGLANVENKSGATIRSEMTKAEVTKALTYTPVPPTNIVDPNLATVSGFAADALATKNQLNELNKNLPARRINDFNPSENFKTHNTAIFYSPATNMVHFCVKGEFKNGARFIGSLINYKPNFDVMLQSSLNAKGAYIRDDGQIILYENNTEIGVVVVSGSWSVGV